MVDYLTHLHLEDDIGSYDPRDVIVLADSGYDDKKIEQTIVNKRWTFIIALKKTRSVKSETLYLTTPLSRQWCHIATFFRNHRRLNWTTMRVMTNGRKRKRMEFRIRRRRNSARRRKHSSKTSADFFHLERQKTGLPAPS